MRRKCDRHGVAAVEFALIAPIFFMIVLGVFEFGRTMMVQQSMINATREGARKAIFSDSTIDKAKDAVVNHLAGNGIKIPRDNITVSPNPQAASNGDSITVTATLPYSEFAWLPAVYMQGRSLDASTTMSYETTD